MAKNIEEKHLSHFRRPKSSIILKSKPEQQVIKAKKLEKPKRK